MPFSIVSKGYSKIIRLLFIYSDIYPNLQLAYTAIVYMIRLGLHKGNLWPKHCLIDQNRLACPFRAEPNG